jgi:glycosyltransferase involved in cell wall biosynthesis
MELDLSLVIPQLNEEESLPELEQWIRRVVEAEGYSYEVIFIDDGSTDKSWSVIEQLQQQNPHVKGIKFRRNYGKSAALNEGFRICKGRVVITMDADLQDSPDEIPHLYRKIKDEGYDIVSGWKKVRHDPIGKTAPSKFFNYVTRKMSGIELHDFNCGLKAYSGEVIKNIEVYGDMHRYIPVIAKWAGFQKITEQVVEHRARKYGYSKFGMSRLITGFLDMLSITFVGKFGKRPMHLFGGLGTLCFSVGFITLLWLTLDKIINKGYGMTERPMFYFGILLLIVGSQLFLAGFLAEMIARTSPSRNNYLVEKTI